MDGELQTLMLMQKIQQELITLCLGDSLCKPSRYSSGVVMTTAYFLKTGTAGSVYMLYQHTLECTA